MKRGENVSTSIDSLNIQITADATKASNAIDGLVRRLDLLTKELGKVNGNKLVNFSNSLNTISVAMNNFSGIKLPDFNRVAKGINKLATIDTTNLSRVGNELAPLANSISAFSNVNFDNRNLQGFINSLSRLASANVGSLASADFNALGQSLNQLATSLSNAPKIQQSVIQMTSAIANLAKSGANIPTVVNSLPTLSTALNQFMIAMSSAPAMTSGTITFTTAIAQLASAGNRAAASATGLLTLGANLRTVIENLSTMPLVNNSIVQLTSALAQLSRAGTSAGNSLKTLSSRFKSYSLNALSASKHTNTLAVSFANLYAKIWSLVRIFRLLKKAIDVSSDLTEVQNVVDVTFGKYAQMVEKMADTSIADYGMSELTVKQVSSRFQAMGTAMGFAQSQMANMSIELTKLTADMASFYNVEQKDVAEDLAAIFTGQTRPLRTYGIDLTQATLKQWALNNGIKANFKTMSQAEKAWLRYQYVMEQTVNAQGDFSRTSDTWANQTRILKQNFEQLGSVIGRTAIAALKPWVKALNTVIQHITHFAEVVSAALGKIFGWKFETGSGGVTSDMEDAEDAAGGLSDGLSDAVGNAKKLKQQLAGFDELEIIQSKDEDASGGGVSGGAVSPPDMGGWTEQESIVDSFTSKLNSLYQLGEHVGDTLTKALNGIDWDSVYQGARNFGTGLAQFLNGLISPDLFGAVGRTIAGALNTITYASLSFGEEFDWHNLGESLAAGINNFFETFDATAAAENINVWIKGALETVTTLLDETDFELIGNKIGEFLSELDFGEILGDIAGLVWEALKGGFAGIKGIFEEAPLEASLISAFAICKFTGLGDKVGGLIGNAVFDSLKEPKTWANLGGAVIAGVAGWNLGQALWEAVSGDEIEMTWTEQFGEIFKSFTDGTWTDALTLWGEDVYNAFVQIGEDQDKWFEEKVIWFNENVIIPVTDFFEDLWKKVAEFFTNLWDDIKKIWEKVSDWFDKNVITPVVDFFSQLYEDVSGFFSDLWTEIKEAWGNAGTWFEEHVTNPISEAFNGIVNTITNCINKVKEFLGLANEASKNPLTTGGLGGAIGGIVQLPAYATGGFPKEDGLFMANRGELVGQFSNGKTAVANNEQITTGIANAVYPAVYNAVSEAMRSNAGSNEPKIKVFVGDRELTDIVIDGVNDRFRRTGNFAFDI